ncbi:hypothetical protein QEW_1034 [Clostridioides difficile CD160]|nr:hypothetical protein QEW_1034 [Clostridioides difficile CD160]
MYYKKIFFTGACALTLISSFGIQALAYEPLETSEYLEDGTVFMVNIKGAGCDLKITSGKAHISCYVDGKLGTSTSITENYNKKINLEHGPIFLPGQILKKVLVVYLKMLVYQKDILIDYR